MLAAALILLAILIALAALQLGIVRIAERRVGKHLTAAGGSVTVAIRALPASRLLRRGGQRLAVHGEGLVIALAEDRGGLAALDGFEEVDIVLTELVTGPFEVSELELRRTGSHPYAMRATASTTGSGLADFSAAHLGLGSAPALGAIARGAGIGERRLPVSIDVELRSEAGKLRIVAGGGQIGRYPAGRLATTLALAVAARLELTV